MLNSDDTIYALATPPGKSGVAVVRLSGKQAANIIELFTRKPLPMPRKAELRSLFLPGENEALDSALILYFPAPYSFTGEAIAELHTHGSRAVLESLFQALHALPQVRLAEPGEFSRRALLNGKMDLTEIEGLADLIDAETESQRRQAKRLMEGDARKQYEAMRFAIIRALALLEAYIDFPDEDLPEHVWQSINDEVNQLRDKIQHILQTGRATERIRSGFTVVILGAPNTGKSSLLNALAQRDIAIVSNIAGTTRDTLELHLNIDGYAVTVIDTAGLRNTSDLIEQEGIRRAKLKAEDADITLLLFDASQSIMWDANTIASHDERSVVVASKADIATGAIPSEFQNIPIIQVSSYAPNGLDCLLEALKNRLIALANTASDPLLTRARHRQQLEKAMDSLCAFTHTKPIELACEDLRLAADALGNITGKIYVDELLDHIFKQFCIGK